VAFLFAGDSDQPPHFQIWAIRSLRPRPTGGRKRERSSRGSPLPLSTGDELLAVPQNTRGPAQFKSWRLRPIYFC